jgi:hypothetical protein
VWSDAYMAKRLDWEKRSSESKPKRSLKDQEEFHKTDLAARWLKRAEQKNAEREACRQAEEDRRRVAASGNRKGRRSFALRCRIGSSSKLPWEE